jgi:hypothetical protein
VKIKVSAGFSGTISVGSYENAKPSYIAEVEYEHSGNGDKTIRETIEETQKLLQDICLANFKADEQRLIVERIQRERADMRFYDGLPSVTSILGWDQDFFVSPQDLAQYAAQGSLYHLQVEHFIKTGEWENVEKIEGSYVHLVILKGGSLGLTWNDWDFPAFLKKYPFEKMEVGGPVKSLKHKFGGTPDISSCIHDGKRTLADVKRTPDKVKHFSQCAAYAIALEENGAEPFEQYALIPANNKTQQGFSKPVVTTETGQFKTMFLKARENFAKRYGI